MARHLSKEASSDHGVKCPMSAFVEMKCFLVVVAFVTSLYDLF